MCCWLYWVTDNTWGWVECVTDCASLLTILGDEWNVLLTEICYWMYWVTDNYWEWVECVTDWNMLLTVLGYWQYLGMSGMCYWLKYVTDCTGLLKLLGYWMHLGYWMDYPTGWTGLLNGPTYWLYRVAGWSWLLTLRILLLKRLCCWIDRGVGAARLLTGPTSILLASQTDWTVVLVILHLDRVDGSIDSLAVSVYCGLMSGLFSPWPYRINQLVTRLKSSTPLTGMLSIRIGRDPAFWQLQSADSAFPLHTLFLLAFCRASHSHVTGSNIYKRLNFIR